MSDYPNDLQHQGLEEDDGISISEYLNILLDEWRLLLVPFALVVLGTLGYLLVVVPSYNSVGVIQVSTSDSSDAEAILDLAIGQPSQVDTEMEIIRSRRIVGEAIRKLSLNVVVPQRGFTLDFRVSLNGKSPLSKELKAIRQVMENVVVADWIESPVEAKVTLLPKSGLEIQVGTDPQSSRVLVGEKFEKRGVSFTCGPVGQFESELSLDVFLLPDDVAVKGILDSLRTEGVGGGRKETNLVRVAFENTDRVVARDFVNALMDTYMDYSLQWKTLRADRSAAFIDGQIEALRTELDGAETELQKFTEINGAVLLSEQAKELIQNGSDLSLEMRKVRVQEDLLSMVKMNMRRSIKRGESAALSGDIFFENPSLSETIGALNELELKRDVLLSDVTPAHPEIVRLNEQITRANEQVRDLVSASRNRIRERRLALSKELVSIQTTLSSFPDKERKLAVLKRNLGASQEMYSFLLGKLEETQILKASTTTDKRIIDKAMTPPKHEKPKRKTTLVLAVVLGLLLGIGMVFGRRAIDPRVRDEEEAKELSGLATYGVVPDLRVLGLLTSDVSTPRPIWETPKGPAAESFRTIRTNVEFAQVDGEPLKVIQITSSQASEGKSTVIANLAIALARAGHKILIVDLDLRRPSLHRVLEVPRVPGISDHVVGHAEINVHRKEEYNIDFVSAGNEPPESQRLLSSSRIGELVETWKSKYDYVLLDTPPLLVADSLVISKLSDMVLFVIRPKHCRRDHLKLAKSTADRMELVKGLIINGVATRRGGYYHYYRGSYYGSKSSDTQES